MIKLYEHFVIHYVPHLQGEWIEEGSCPASIVLTVKLGEGWSLVLCNGKRPWSVYWSTLSSHLINSGNGHSNTHTNRTVLTYDAAKLWKLRSHISVIYYHVIRLGLHPKTKCEAVFFKGCILLCVRNIYEFYFSCQTQQYTKQLAHISLCVSEFIGHVMLQHVLAQAYINRPYTVELCLLCGSIYCTNHCVTRNWNIRCASFPFVNHLYVHKLSGCVFILL
jgi:hypothetical protein